MFITTIPTNVFGVGPKCKSIAIQLQISAIVLFMHGDSVMDHMPNTSFDWRHVGIRKSIFLLYIA